LLGGNQQMVPLMSTWASDIVERIDRHSYGLSGILGLQRDMAGEDFEHQLGLFLAWERGLTITAELADLGEENLPGGAPRVFEKWAAKAWASAELINQAILESLFACFGASAVSPVAASKAYGVLMELFKVTPTTASLTVATTNYDCAMEEGLQLLNWAPYWGEDSRTSTTGGSPPLRLTNLSAATEIGRSPILHLHGRVGWYRRDDGQLVSLPPESNYNKDFGTPGLLLPEPNKRYEEDAHFRIMWEEFGKAIERAGRILVLGHSLNDAGLREALAPTVGNRLRVTMCVEDAEGTSSFEREKRRILELLPGLPPGAVIPMTFGPDLHPDGNLKRAFEEWRP
jgi:hypothetical protein